MNVAKIITLPESAMPVQEKWRETPAVEDRSWESSPIEFEELDK